MLKRMFKAIGRFYAVGQVAPVPIPMSSSAQASQSVDAVDASGFILPAKVPSGTPSYEGVPIPKYPDHGIAVPAATPQMLIESQHHLLKELQQASGLSHDDFNDLILPVVHNYACFVHLLPGSESHHHCAQGGLFRHGLEVAYYAARKCESKVFALDYPPSIRKHLEPRWVVAAILGGLMHDIGKPQVDVGAVDASGNLVWDPFKESLYAWLVSNSLKYYYIMWRAGARDRRHEARTIFVVDRLIPDNTSQWLADYQGHVAVDAMIDALSGAHDSRNPLTSVILSADLDSVSRDVEESRNRLGAAGTGGVRSLAARIIRAMHDKVASAEWKINEIGGFIWITDEGTFAKYPDACSAAIEVLRADGDNSLSNDATTVMKVLVDHGYLMVNNQEDGRSFQTWHGEIHAEDRGQEFVFSIHALRFLHSPIIPTTIVHPEPVRIDLLNASGVIMNPRHVVNKQKQDPPAIVEQHADDVAPTPVRTNADTGTPNDRPVKPAPPQGEWLPPPPAPKGSQATGGSEIDAYDPQDTPVPPSGTARAELRNRRTEEEVRDELLRESRAAADAKWPPQSAQEAREWFAHHGEAGAILVEIAERIYKRRLIEDLDVIDGVPHIHIRYPQGFEELAIMPSEITKILEVNGWSERDPANPRVGAVMLNRGGQTYKCVRLTERISDGFRKLLPTEGVIPSVAKAKKAFPLGPYIDGRTAGLLECTDARTVNASDVPHIRLAFSKFMKATTVNTPPSEDVFTSEALKGYIAEFAKAHNMHAAGLRLLLTTKSVGNPILEVNKSSKAAQSSSGIKLKLSDSYSVEMDEAQVHAAFAADPGERS